MMDEKTVLKAVSHIVDETKQMRHELNLLKVQMTACNDIMLQLVKSLNRRREDIKQREATMALILKQLNPNG